MSQRTKSQRTTRKKRSVDKVLVPDPSSDLTKTLEQIVGYHQGGNVDALRDIAVDLVHRSLWQKQREEQLSEVHESLKAQCEAMAAHEHHKVVIVGVSLNGSRTVEVAGPSTGRMNIAVHPDVDSDRLRIGATGWVTSDRNCLLDIASDSALWADVATYEKSIEEDRILIRHRDELVVVQKADQLRDVDLNRGDLVGFDREVSRLAYQRLDPVNQSHLFDDSIEACFDELVGLDTPIALIRNVIDFRLLHPELAEAYGLPRQNGLLLYGPAGNGKTHTARCVAAYLRELFPDKPCRFMHISGSQDYSKWFGESEQQIIQRFQAAHRSIAGRDRCHVF